MKRILALLMCVCLLPLCAAAEDLWVLGAWTMVYGMQDGKRLEPSEIVNGEAAMLRFDADGTVTSFTVRNGAAAVDGNAVTWTATGKLITVAGGISVTLQGNGMMRMSGAGQDAFMRRATEEETALLSSGTVEEETPADHSWLMGEWEYRYAIKGDQSTSALIDEGDYARVIFSEDGTFTLEAVIAGEAFTSVSQWTYENGLYFGNECPMFLTADGMLQVLEDEEAQYYARPAGKSAPGTREQDVVLTDQLHQQGVEEPETGSGWALTLVDMPACEALHSLSPSGRYVILELEDHAFALYDLQNGTQKPITYDTARTRSVQDDHQSLEELEKAGLLYYTGHVAWSPDERYAAVVNMGGTAMIQPYTDLYVLDTETGMVFMPAAWGKDTEINGNGFGVVVAVTFAPDGTLYALVQESGEVGSGDRVYIHGAPYVIYRCSPSTGETVRVRELTDVQPLTEHLFACSSDGDLMLLGSSRADHSSSIHLIIGAQDPAREKALPLGNHGAPDSLVVRASGMAALQWFDVRMQGTDTVTMLDLGKPLPPLATGLVVSASGFVSELPLINSRSRNARAIQQRWMSIGSDVKAGAHMHIQQSTLSPDGSLLLAKTNKGIYVMDTLTRVMTPVSCSVALKDRPLDIQWGGDYVMLRWMSQSVMLRMREY